jgi:hypothetical protein
VLNCINKMEIKNIGKHSFKLDTNGKPKAARE